MRGIDAVPVSGTPDDVVRGLREVIDAGAEMLLLNPVGSDVPENREQMERLAAEVIPRLELAAAEQTPTKPPTRRGRAGAFVSARGTRVRWPSRRRR